MKGIEKIVLAVMLSAGGCAAQKETVSLNSDYVLGYIADKKAFKEQYEREVTRAMEMEAKAVNSSDSISYEDFSRQVANVEGMKKVIDFMEKKEEERQEKQRDYDGEQNREISWTMNQMHHRHHLHSKRANTRPRGFTGGIRARNMGSLKYRK